MLMIISMTRIALDAQLKPFIKAFLVTISITNFANFLFVCIIKDLKGVLLAKLITFFHDVLFTIYRTKFINIFFL